MTEDGERLAAVGEALYGPLWQTSLSVALEVSDRTVRRWAAGDVSVPERVWRDIGAICRKRGAALEKWAAKLI
jgi:hypothetical protein